MRTAFAALYLPGGPRAIEVPRRSWPMVLGLLRMSIGNSPGDDLCAAAKVLQDAGFWQEAALLQCGRVLDWALRHADTRNVLMACDGEYPTAWLKLGARAAPAFWIRGDACCDGGWSTIGIVGSRHITRVESHFAKGVAATAVSLGYQVVSGGASGADLAGERAAIAAGGEVIEILPGGLDACRHGLPRSVVADGNVLQLSARPPWEEFSTAAAMERNALIYALGPTVVVASKYKEGGAWHGASDALRRRLGRVLVRDDGRDLNTSNRGLRALIALGGTPIGNPSELQERIMSPRLQSRLFG